MRLRSTSALAAAFGFLALAAAVRALPAAPPDSPQGRRMAALLAAFDAGTDDALRAFVHDHFAASAQKEVPLEQRVKRLGAMAREIGPLEFHSAMKSEGPEVLFLARSKKSGQWFEVGMMLEPAPAFGILGLKFEASEGPGAERVAPLGSDAAAAAQAGADLRRRTEADEFSGVVLVAKDGKPFFFEPYGLADRDFGVPNRSGHEVQHRFDQQGLHAGGDRPARLAGEAGALGHGPQAPARLSVARRGSDHHPGARDDVVRPRRLLRRQVRATPKSKLRSALRLPAAFRRSAAALRARNQPALLERRLRRARPHHRESDRARRTTTTCASTFFVPPG